MAAVDGNFYIFPIFIDCILEGGDGWGRLDGGAEDNRLTIADAAQDSPGMVGGASGFSMGNFKTVVIFGTKGGCCGKSVPNLKPIHSPK